MLLATHIIFAVASLALMLTALIGRLHKPTGDYTWLAQGSAITFVGLFGTGTVLVIQSNTHILGACLKGLVYLGCLAGTYLLYKKVAIQ